MKYLFIFLIFIYSCNPAKRLAREQDKALSSVLASKKHLDEAGKAWALLNPCVTQTEFEIIPGDSIPYPVLIADTAGIKRVLDSVKLTQLVECVTDVKEAYRRGYADALATVPKTKFKAPDTVKIRAADLRAIDILKHENIELTAKNNALNDQLLAANKKDEDHKGKICFPWWVLLIVGILTGGGVTKVLRLW